MTQELPHQETPQQTESFQAKGLELLSTITETKESFAITKAAVSLLSQGQNSIRSKELGTQLGIPESSRRGVVLRLEAADIFALSKDYQAESPYISSAYAKPLAQLFTAIDILTQNNDTLIPDFFPGQKSALEKRRDLINLLLLPQFQQGNVTDLIGRVYADYSHNPDTTRLHTKALGQLGILAITKQPGTGFLTYALADLQKLQEYQKVFDAATDLARAMQPQAAVQEKEIPQSPAEIAEEPPIDIPIRRGQKETPTQAEKDLRDIFENNEDYLITEGGYVIARGNKVERMLIENPNRDKFVSLGILLEKDAVDSQNHHDSLRILPTHFFQRVYEMYPDDAGIRIFLGKGKPAHLPEKISPEPVRINDTDTVEKKTEGLLYAVARVLEKARAKAAGGSQRILTEDILTKARDIVSS